MLYCGNDIVNLQNQDFESEERFLRWVSKVANPGEKQWILEATNPQLALWKLWAAKESAYKVFMKLGIPPFVNAKKIKVTPDSAPNHFMAELEDLQLFGFWEYNPQWLHAVATNDKTREIKPFCKIITNKTRQPSLQIRIELTKLLLQKHGLVLKAIKKHNNIPLAIIDNQDSPIDLSFSHHSPYSALAFLLKTAIDSK